MTGVFNVRPPQPKLSSAWNAGNLSFLKNKVITLLFDKVFTQKLFILLLSLGSQTQHYKFSIVETIIMNDLSVTFHLKSTKGFP